MISMRWQSLLNAFERSNTVTYRFPSYFYYHSHHMHTLTGWETTTATVPITAAPIVLKQFTLLVVQLLHTINNI